jgi:predicted RNase H-like HicB family nuclease
MEPRKCRVTLIWAEEDGEGSWYTDSDDIPGLSLEAKTFDALVERVRQAAPEMLELNLGYTGPVELEFASVRSEYLAAS